MAYKLLDFQDIYTAICEELKVPLSDTSTVNRIKRDINMIYLDEVVPFKRWFWLLGHTVVTHRAGLKGSCSVTPDVATITLASAPNVSLGSFKGYKFAVDSFDEVYTISAHTAGSTTVTLDAAYQGALTTTASYQIWKDLINLPLDCRETIDVYHNRYKKKMEGKGYQELRDLIEAQPVAEAWPMYYNTTDYYDDSASEVEATRYRQMRIHPALNPNSENVTISIDYTKEILPLDEDSDEPMMPLEDRVVLLYGGLSRAWARERNPEESARNFQLFQNKLGRMAGKVEDGNDFPKFAVKSSYLQAKRRSQLGRYYADYYGDFGRGSGASLPTFLRQVTLEGGNITDDFTVSNGVTIDGRDISVDGAALDAHLIATSVHGITGNVVGDTDAQTLSNKGINADTNAISNISNDEIKLGASIAFNKMEVLSASLAVITDSDGVITSSPVTSTELIYLSDVEPLTQKVLLDNVSDQTVKSWDLASFDSIILKYSVKRDATFDVGFIVIATDGSTVSVSPVGASVGTTGVSFNGIISGSDLVLRYSTTNTGSNGSMQYKVDKWLA